MGKLRDIAESILDEAKEHCIASSRNWTYNDENHPNGRWEDSAYYHHLKMHKKIGDEVSHEVGAPGYGRNHYKITRMDHTGVYGRKTDKSRSGILKPRDVK
jgi:hypothetical protein